MTWVLTTDGTTVDQWQKNKPTGEWPNLEQPGFNSVLRPESDLDATSACGWYEAATTVAPPNDADNTYVETAPTNTGTNAFEQAWTHDPTAHARRIDRQTRKDLAQGVIDQIGTMRTWADDAAAVFAAYDTADDTEKATWEKQTYDRLSKFFTNFADYVEAREGLV